MRRGREDDAEDGSAGAAADEDGAGGEDGAGEDAAYDSNTVTGIRYCSQNQTCAHQNT